MLTHTNGSKQQEGKKSMNMHSYAFELSYKCQKVPDTKSHNASHIYLYDLYDQKNQCKKWHQGYQ